MQMRADLHAVIRQTDRRKEVDMKTGSLRFIQSVAKTNESQNPTDRLIYRPSNRLAAIICYVTP